MRIFAIGAPGFLGSALVPELIQAEHLWPLRVYHFGVLSSDGEGEQTCKPVGRAPARQPNQMARRFKLSET